MIKKHLLFIFDPTKIRISPKTIFDFGENENIPLVSSKFESYLVYELFFYDRS